MLLVQNGQIRLDDPVSKYLEAAPDTWKAITVQLTIIVLMNLDDVDVDAILHGVAALYEPAMARK